MDNLYLLQLDIMTQDDKQIIPPKIDSTPISPTEKLVREEIKKLNENTEEIKKLKEEIEKKQKNK